MTRINVCYHPCQISNCTNARSPRCPAVSPACRCPSPVEEVPPASWKHQRGGFEGEWRRRNYTPQRLEGPKNYGWQKATPALNMARIWYLCEVSGLQSWICVSSKLDAWNIFLPNDGFDVDIFYIIQRSNPTWKTERVIEVFDLARLPLSAEINRMNFKPGRRANLPEYHGSSNLCFLSF